MVTVRELKAYRDKYGCGLYEAKTVLSQKDIKFNLQETAKYLTNNLLSTLELQKVLLDIIDILVIMDKKYEQR